VLGNVPAFEALLDWVDGRIKSYETEVRLAINTNIKTNTAVINENITLASGYNGNSVGPIAIKKGTTVKIEKGAYWLITGKTHLNSQAVETVEKSVSVSTKELNNVENLPVVYPDEVKKGIGVNKYMTHEMFVAAIAAMGGIGGGASTATYSVSHAVVKGE
jgi:hypothetical protein